MSLRKIQDLDLKDQRVFLRLDLNVPIKNGKIKDDTRIQAALETIRYVRERTDKLVICSHLGRPDGAKDPAYSTEPIGARLAELLDCEVLFVDDFIEESVKPVVDNAPKGSLVLLENLRFWPGETKNDPEFATKLIEGFDFYINDAFGTVHRAHASTYGAALLLPPERRAAGFLVQKEVAALGNLLKAPEAPFVAVVGGAKVSDKMAILLSLIQKCHSILIGGAMAYTFLKWRGHTVGSSRVESDKLDLVAQIYQNADARKVEILLPEDHMVAEVFEESALPTLVDAIDIPEGLMGLDIGPKTQALYQKRIKAAKTVLWNGPMGVFEWPAFAFGSTAVAKAMAECRGNTVIGGGDSVSAAKLAGVESHISHISTGGGASLEFLEGQSLPGLKVLEV